MYFLYGERAQLIRFVTPTENWPERMDNKICVPSQWPLMLVQLLIQEGQGNMSSVLGVSPRTARDLAMQGIYQYSFDDLLDDVVAAIEQHFNSALVDLQNPVDALLVNVIKPRLTLIKK